MYVKDSFYFYYIFFLMGYLKKILYETELKCEILLYKIFIFKFILNLYKIELCCIFIFI